MKVTANFATYKPRIENGSLRRAVESIINQVDLVRIFCNGIKDLDAVEAFLKPVWYNGKILLINGWDQDFDLTDNGKFYALESMVKEPEIYLMCDDDIIYPPDYVSRISEAIDRYKCIVSFHGRQLLGSGLKYYNDHKIFHCLHGVVHDEMVDVIGTGVAGFDTRYFRPKGLAYSDDKRMSDLVFSLEAAKQGKQMGVISHAPNWLQMIPNKQTIHDTESVRETPRQNRLANEIFELKYGTT